MKLLKVLILSFLLGSVCLASDPDFRIFKVTPKAVPAKQLVVRKVFDRNFHTHLCVCGNEWSHTGNTGDSNHQCGRCGRYTYVINQQNTRIVAELR